MKLGSYEYYKFLLDNAVKRRCTQDIHYAREKLHEFMKEWNINQLCEYCNLKGETK